MAYDLPKILKDHRAKHDLSQEQLAKMLNTEQSYISRIERRERRSKESDIDFLRLVSERLKIPPEELGLISSKAELLPHKVTDDLLDWSDNVIELADNVRSRGDSEAAIKHLEPIVSALEDQAHRSAASSVVLELYGRAKLTYGTALGDQLPPDKLGTAIRHLEEANRVVAPDNRDLKAQVLRAYGNELRKSGQGESALETLRQAKELGPRPIVNGSLAIALARAEADMQNWPEFRHAISDARRALNKQIRPHPLFNEFVIHEATLRGLLIQEDVRGVARELSRPVPEPLNLAAQWRAIYAVTEAEALLFTGEFAHGVLQSEKALSGAKELFLPQQIIRLQDILFRYRKMSSAVADLLEVAQRAFITKSR